MQSPTIQDPGNNMNLASKQSKVIVNIKYLNNYYKYLFINNNNNNQSRL